MSNLYSSREKKIKLRYCNRNNDFSSQYQFRVILVITPPAEPLVDKLDLFTSGTKHLPEVIPCLQGNRCSAGEHQHLFGFLNSSLWMEIPVQMAGFK